MVLEITCLGGLKVWKVEGEEGKRGMEGTIISILQRRW